MISGGTVTGDLSKATNTLQNFSSSISGLSSSWKGASFSNLNSKVSEAVSTCISTISGQMNAFASACSLYQEYKQVKEELAMARASYNAAKNDPKKNASQYSSRISTLTNKLNELKSQIEGLLAAASGGAVSSSAATSASASAGGDTSSSGGSTTTQKTIPEQALTIKTAEVTAADIIAKQNAQSKTLQNKETTKTTNTIMNTTSSKDWTSNSNFKYYNQGSGWNNYAYSGGGGTATMKQTGCGPTSMAMVLSSLGKNVNPNTAAEWSTKHGYHGNGTLEGYFTSYAKDAGVQSKVLGKSSSNIKNALNNNELVIMYVGPGDFTDKGHYIVARGYDSKSNKVLIADPYTEKNNKWYDLDRVVGQLKGKESSWSFSA